MAGHTVFGGQTHHRGAQGLIIRHPPGETKATVIARLYEVPGLANELVDHRALIAGADIGHGGLQFGIAHFFETIAQTGLEPGKTEAALVARRDSLGEFVDFRIAQSGESLDLGPTGIGQAK